MDRVTLKKLAASRRNDVQESEPPRVKWTCGFCSRDFQLEARFMEHKCREKERHYELRSSVGLAAYAHYSEWMRQKKHTVPPIETFAEARLYTTFVKFAEYCTRVHIPNVRQFITVMIESNISPVLWSRDQMFSMYLERYDTSYKPESQALDSIQLIKDLADDLCCEPRAVFKEISIERLVKLIQQRKLSPWFLLASNEFKKFLVDLTPERKVQLQIVLNPGAMIERIRRNEELFRTIKAAVAEEGL